MAAELVDGLLKLTKVDQQDGRDVYIRPSAIDAIEPVRRGCMVFSGVNKWLVQHLLRLTRGGALPLSPATPREDAFRRR